MRARAPKLNIQFDLERENKNCIELDSTNEEGSSFLNGCHHVDFLRNSNLLLDTAIQYSSQSSVSQIRQSVGGKEHSVDALVG